MMGSTLDVLKALMMKYCLAPMLELKKDSLTAILMVKMMVYCLVPGLELI